MPMEELVQTQVVKPEEAPLQEDAVEIDSEPEMKEEEVSAEEIEETTAV